MSFAESVKTGEQHGRRSPAQTVNRRSSIVDPNAFTLIELLVVIAVIALLLAIFIPAARAAREKGQRAVCLSNLRQLTMAWINYADEHDSKLVGGGAFGARGSGRRKLEGWVGRAFSYPKSRTALVQNPNKGPLWPYLRDVDVYRCPRGWTDHCVTYATVVSANNNLIEVEGTYVPGSRGLELTDYGQRVGGTVLKLTRLTDIVSPGASQRAVFIDMGQTPDSSDFYVPYLQPQWQQSVPPIRHADGVTLSLADGHAEYWKWKGRETVEIPRLAYHGGSSPSAYLENENYAPQTEDGLYDLQRLQRATWGRLGYPAEQTP